MEVDTSNDVETIETVESNETEKYEDRPIMLLIKQLISNDNTKSTVLTNAQIFDILLKEFDIDVSKKGVLEIEIYLNIMKKFLKDWPMWDKFDRIVNRHKRNKAQELFNQSMESNYDSLKNYLKGILAMAKPLADEAVDSMNKEKDSLKPQEEIDDKDESNDVVMELFCSRQQLNQLIIRHPQGELSKDIFSLKDGPHKIIVNNFNMKSILNQWNVKLMINLNTFVYRREMKGELKQVLVNKKNKLTTQLKVLDTRLQEMSKKTTLFSRNSIDETIAKILNIYAVDIKMCTLLEQIFQIIKDDLKDSPPALRMPAYYRRYLSKYPYVRYLYAEELRGEVEKESENSKYDLQIEEIIYPRCEFFIGKVDSQVLVLPSQKDWIKIECGQCYKKFTGSDVIEDVKSHFMNDHLQEPDWECMNCKLKFDMRYITEAGWSHECKRDL